MSDPMRPEDFGESGRLVLNHARRIAVDMGSKSIGTPHLFLGVVALEDPLIKARLEGEALDLAAVAGRVRERLVERGSEAEISFEAAVGALEEASRAASVQANPLIEAPHILIGVLRDRGGVVVNALTNAGADPEQLDKRLWVMLERGEWSADPYRERRAIQQPGIATPSEVLESLGRDLTAAARAGELSQIIGRDAEAHELITVLSGMRKRNALLIGDAGVGKTAIVEGLAQRIVAGEVPEQLEGMTIRTIEVGSLVAGTMYRGQFEEKLRALVDAARARDDLILFIDEMHALIGAGRAEGISADASDYLKPALTEGKLKVIGATTPEEFRQHIERDAALMRRFQQVVVGEPSREDALSILRGLRPRYSEFHGVEIEDDALEACVDLSVRHLHGRFLPDKALDLLDRACTQEKLERGMARWMPAVARRPDDPADELVVDDADVADVVTVLLEIPTARLRPDELGRLREMGAALRRRVIGQDEAVDAVAASILAARTIEDPKRPYGVFLFLGPTGVGKTRLAQEIAGFLFGDDDRLIRFDMSEFSEPHTASGLIGAPPPYPGWEQGGRLTNAVRAKPYSVVLFDEIEKAHPEVRETLLGAFDEGRLTDRAGRRIDFRNTVIVMTSNVGARQIQASRPIGFVAEGDDELSYEEVRRQVDRELERAFAPEFLNRIDELLVFRPQSRENLRTILGLLVEEMIPLRLELSDDALDHLVEASYDPAMGARPARRAIQRLLRNPLSLMLAHEEISDEDAIAVELRQGALTFSTKSAAAAAGA